jgi:hypothetical protein
LVEKVISELVVLPKSAAGEPICWVFSSQTISRENSNPENGFAHLMQIESIKDDAYYGQSNNI